MRDARRQGEHSCARSAFERAQSLAGSYREMYDLCGHHTGTGCVGTTPGGVVDVWRGNVHVRTQDD